MLLPAYNVTHHRLQDFFGTSGVISGYTGHHQLFEVFMQAVQEKSQSLPDESFCGDAPTTSETPGYRGVY
jgi:hypothetical protein